MFQVPTRTLPPDGAGAGGGGGGGGRRRRSDVFDANEREITDRARRSVRVEDEAHRLRAWIEVDVHREILIRRPSTGVWNAHRTRSVDAVELHVEGPAASRRRDARHQPVVRTGADVDAVLQPFAGVGPADGISTVLRGLDVDIGRSIGAAGVARRLIVVADAVAAHVEVFRLHGARQRPCRTAVR